MQARRPIFITGTDTGVGKTIATAALGLLFKDHGLDVGVMKPVQCAGDDAAFLKKTLDVKDPLKSVNPYYAAEPLSPHLAFARGKVTIKPSKIIEAFQSLSQRHDIMLVEGAGGLMV